MDSDVFKMNLARFRAVVFRAVNRIFVLGGGTLEIEEFSKGEFKLYGMMPSVEKFNMVSAPYVFDVNRA